MKLLFTGDVNFHGIDNMSTEVAKELLCEAMPYFKAADFVIPNLECPLADEGKYAPIGKSGPPLICAQRNIEFLKVMGAHAVTIANNHIGDYGDGALFDTLKLLSDNGIKYAGAGKNVEEAYKACRFEKDGESVSVLSVCETEFGTAGDNSAGGAGYAPRRLFAAIRREKEAANKVIVVFHGGNEFVSLPSPDTVERYRLICDMGADAVIAGHTHAPQGYEMYDGKPIVYSLGNFIFKSLKVKPSNDPWYYGYFVIVDTDDMSITPVPCRFNTEGTRIFVLEGDEKKVFMDYLAELSAIILRPEELKNYFMGWSWSRKFYPKLEEAYGEEAHKPHANLNLVRCPAHHSVMVSYLETLCYEKEAEAEAWYEKLKKLIDIPTV